MNNTREEIVSELKRQGYNARLEDIDKNGQVYPAILMIDDNITPIIYLDSLLKNFSNIDDIVNQIISIYKSKCKINIDVNLFKDRNWILNHCFIALQETVNESNVVKRPINLTGLEQYIYLKDITDTHMWSCKLTTNILSQTALSEETVWEAGIHNTFSKE